MIHLDHLGSDGRHAQGFMGLSKIKVWHGLDCEPPPAPQPQPAETRETANVGASSTKASAHKPAKPSATAHKSGNSTVKSPATAHKSANSADTARGPGTPPTSHRLQPSDPRFAHWSGVTKPRDPHASKAASVHASASSFRGASASRNIRNACQNLATAGAGLIRAAAMEGAKANTYQIAKQEATGKASAIEQDLVKRLSEFVSALPVEKLETTTSKDAKDAVMHFFDDWNGVWKAHKPFFRCVCVCVVEGRVFPLPFCVCSCGAGGSSSGQ
jgi:hypothetical protein